MNKIRNNKIVTYGLLFLILIIYYFLHHTFGVAIPCMFKEITGFYCPGCGITRMLFSIIKLDFYQAFRYNPFIFLLLIIYIGFLLIKIIIKIISNKDIKIPEYVYYILILLLLIYWVLRNIPSLGLYPIVI